MANIFKKMRIIFFMIFMLVAILPTGHCSGWNYKAGVCSFFPETVLLLSPHHNKQKRIIILLTHFRTQMGLRIGNMTARENNRVLLIFQHQVVYFCSVLKLIEEENKFKIFLVVLSAFLVYII